MESNKRVVVVAGAGSQIGSAIAKNFADAGDTVIVAGYDDPAGAAAAEQMGLAYKEVDGSQLASTDELFAQVVEEQGAVDVFVNYLSYGETTRVSAKDITLEEWNDIIVHTLTASVFMDTSAARQMSEQKSGKIVNVVSSVGYDPSELANPAYSAACNGVANAARNIARDLMGANVNVNNVVVGEACADFLGEADEALTEAELAKVPAGRMLEPGDVLGLVNLLCSDDASYLSGTTIDVNGGLYYR